MNGDLSRSTFDPLKAYSSVRAQQGRATIDADINEQIDIQLHDLRAGRRALIGASGGHVGEAGFDVQVVANQLQILPGSYWVDGIGITLDGTSPQDLDAQPFLPEFSVPTAAGLYIAYLDVWERPISAVQDPEIREVALGGPDTSIRTQVVWQVRLLPVTTTDPEPDCMTPYPEWARLLAGPQGTLEVRVAPSSQSSDPCLIPENAGFRGLENQLYRLQIHDGNFAPTSASGTDPVSLTFKWSRDNGSVVAIWREHIAPLEIAIDRLGPGGAAGFGADNWVELTNDDDDLLARGGVIGRIASVTGDTLLLDDPNGTLEPALTPVPKSDAVRHSQVRRWDSRGARSTTATVGESDVTPDGWIRIEDGIEVRFSSGSFAAGSYWTVPARTATLPGTADSQVDWPSPGGVPLALRAQGPVHHYARLAVLDFDGANWSRLADCRQLFPALTELVQVQALGGDGQHGRANHWLPAPLTVTVLRGGFPIPGARLRFAISPSQVGGSLRGLLSPTMPDENGLVISSSTSVLVRTDTQGQASVWWRLGSGPVVEELGDAFQRDDAQEVSATLLADDDTSTAQMTRFSARVLDNYVLVDAGGNGQLGQPGETLEIALRARVSDGGRPVPGAHVEFRVLDSVLNGQPLDQFTGGSLIASVNPVLTTVWPNGSRLMSAVVATDVTGTAQVQWLLGTAGGLPVQRIEARLLDEGGQPTSQSTLYTAHLAVASEIGWVMPPILQPHVPNPSGHLQAALDGVAVALGRLGLPLFAVRPRVVGAGNVRLPLEPAANIALANFIGVELQAIFPVGFVVTTTQIEAAISVWFERPLPQSNGAARAVVRLVGDATRQSTTLTWQLPPLTRAWLVAEFAQSPAERRVCVEVLPTALGLQGSSQTWVFTLTP